MHVRVRKRELVDPMGRAGGSMTQDEAVAEPVDNRVRQQAMQSQLIQAGHLVGIRIYAVS